jgi:phospholipid/cholesterol/gamma-HCH transport system substrate-binding protein
VRRPLTALLALALVGATGGCSAVGGTGTYTLTAYFAQSPSLYEKSRVKVMGANVGTIERIEVDQATQKVKITLRVRDDVPLPADVNAAIVSANTVGERNIVLYPAWKPDQPKIRPGAVIPEERTDLPVEIDDALGSFTRLAQSVDPEKLSSTFRGGANMLRGHGEDINGALETIGELTHDLAAQDERLVSLATSLNELAGSLNRRDEKLKALFKAFNDAGGMLATERERLRAFLTGLESVIRQGDVLVEAYHAKLPSTVTDLSEVVMTLKANSASVVQAIESMARIGGAVVRAYDPKRKVVTIRLQLNAVARAWLQPILTEMGMGEVPCFDAPLGNCEVTVDKKTKKKAGGS